MAAGELGAAEAHLAGGEFGVREVDVATGELGAAEVDLAAGELGVMEVHQIPGELGAVEVDHAPGELGMPKTTAVECDAGAVEIESVPCGCCGGASVVGLEVGGDDTDDGVADFAASAQGEPFSHGCVGTGVGLVGHAQVGAEDIDAGLALL